MRDPGRYRSLIAGRSFTVVRRNRFAIEKRFGRDNRVIRRYRTEVPEIHDNDRLGTVGPLEGNLLHSEERPIRDGKYQLGNLIGPPGGERGESRRRHHHQRHEVRDGKDAPLGAQNLARLRIEPPLALFFLPSLRHIHRELYRCAASEAIRFFVTTRRGRFQHTVS